MERCIEKQEKNSHKWLFSLSLWREGFLYAFHMKNSSAEQLKKRRSTGLSRLQLLPLLLLVAVVFLF